MSDTAVTIVDQPQAQDAPAIREDGATAIISMIERAARDPQVDIDKMERLMLMQERAMEKRAKAAYAAALALMQPLLPSVKERGGIKDRNGKVQSTYALWEDINDAIKPVLADHGFALSFRIAHPESMVAVTGVLMHREGHSEETTIRLPHDGSGSKNAVQAVASSVSYGKRYTAGALLNLTSHGEDDDGRSGDNATTVVSDEQVSTLQQLIRNTQTDIGVFLDVIKSASLCDIPASRFDYVFGLLMKKQAKLAQKKKEEAADE